MFNVVRIDQDAVHVAHWRWDRAADEFRPADSLRVCADGGAAWGCGDRPRRLRRRKRNSAGAFDSLGMPAFRGFATHTNRTVLLSVTGRGVLRLHRGYAWAPDRVLAAIVRYVRPGARRATRRAAELEFLAFPVERHAAPARPSRRGAERPRARRRRAAGAADRDSRAAQRRAFRGRPARDPLPAVGTDAEPPRRALRSTRAAGRTLEIAMSRAHLRHGWVEVERTVLHEMVHQWQAESGLPVDHGTQFRRKAREVGIEPTARRHLGHPGPRHTAG